MPQDVLIKIKATDDASAVMKKIGAAGRQMGTEVGQGAEQGGRGLDNLNKRFAAIGAVAATAGSLLGQWNRSAQDANAIQRQLEQAIANTGHSFSEYSARIQEAGQHAVQLGIDDEKASQAIQALTEITGNAVFTGTEPPPPPDPNTCAS